MRAAGSKWAFMAGLALVAAPGIASAMDWRDSAPNGLLYLLVGGGVTDFTEASARDRFGLGGAWDLRVGFGNRFYVGGELAYVGTTRNIDKTSSNLISNGGEAILRLQYPYVGGDLLIEPFAFGGIGWSALFLQDAAPGLDDTDGVGVVPFGGGVTFGFDRLLFEGRFTYRATFSEDLILAGAQTPMKQRQWGVGASVGYQF